MRKSIVFFSVIIISSLLIIYFLPWIWKLPVEYFKNYYSNNNLEFEFVVSSREKIITAFILIIGMGLTSWRSYELYKQNKINKTNNDNNLILQQFSKASELLANEVNIAARLSGIYLFEKIMNESEDYHW